MVKRLLFFLLIQLFVQNIHAQTEIKGKVRDAETNQPVIGATVYLKGGEIGTVTDEDGKFKFKGLPEGTFFVVVKYSGFDSAEKTINTAKAGKNEDGETEVEVNFILRPSHISLAEVQIKRKRDNETDISARDKEKNGDQIVNIVGARSIEISPDITAANVLQRVSGVSIEKNDQGDGRYAILRGMDAHYNNTLLDGFKIPSPDPFNRYVPLDIIPSELLQKIEVYKSLTPDMEGDAIGGTVNLVMKDAPDVPLLSANLFTGYSNLLWSQNFQAFDMQAVNSKDPQESHSAGYVIQPGDFSRKNLEFSPKPFTPYYAGGLIAGKRFLHNKIGVLVSGTRQTKYTTSNNIFYTVAPDIHNTPYYTDVQQITYYDQTIRSGVNAKIDYQINARNSISLTNIYVNLQDIQSKFTSDTSLTTFRVGPGTGQVFLRDRSFHNTQAIETAILNGNHQLLQNVTLTWSGIFSEATYKTPDFAEVSRDLFIDPSHAQSPLFFDGVTHTWQRSKDRDYAATADVEYKPVFLGREFDFKAGGLYRNKSKDNYQNDFELRAPYSDTTTVKAYYVGMATQQWRVFSHTSSSYGLNNYTASEDVLAYYAQVKTNIGPLQVLAGVRTESSTEEYNTQAPAIFSGKSASIVYADVLPNIQFKYTINAIQNLRLAIYQSLSRPSYSELLPASPLELTGNYQQQGNPELQHTECTNADFRYELFPSGSEEMLLGAFYKKLVHPIEAAFDLSNPYNPVYTYSSDGTATNYGFEAAIIKFWGNFGVNANYTYTKSSITTSKAYPDTISGKESFRPETRSLQGQSKSVGNIGLLYRSKRAGINAELAYQYTGKRIVIVGTFYGTDYYQQPLSSLDFSADKTIGKHFGVFVKVNNLLNSPYVVKLTNGMLVEKDYFGFSYLFGLKYKL